MMKIVDVTVHVLGNPWKNWVLVKVSTDAGITGWGDATTGLSTQPVVSALKELRRLYLGKDPLQVERMWEELFKALYLPADGTLLCALAGLQTACWDILGKHLGVPLHQLFGGKVADRIRAYANGWYKGPRDPAFFAERAAEVARTGYSALKFDPFGAAYRFLDPSDRKLSLAVVAAVRDAVGDDMDLMIEVHDRLTVQEAVTVAHALKEYGVFWMEAPVWSVDVGALAAVASLSPVRVVAGERFTHLRQFADLLATGRFDIVQPEYIELGGIHRLRQVAALAEAYGADIAPHNARSPLSTAVNLHVLAACRNGFMLESFEDSYEPWVREVFAGIPAVSGGAFAIPEAPGLGVEVDEDLAVRYPYSDQHFMNLFMPGWETRFPKPAGGTW